MKRRAGCVTTHLRSSKEYVLTGMRARSPAGLGRGAPGLGRLSMSCGERTSSDALRANSEDIVGGGGLAEKGCWTERPRMRRAALGSHISITSISMALLYAENSNLRAHGRGRERMNQTSGDTSSTLRPSPRPRPPHSAPPRARPHSPPA